MRTRTVVRIVVPSLAAGLLACQLIVGVKDDVGSIRPDGGSDAATCILRTPPGSPDADTPGAVDDGAIHYFAFERILVNPVGGPVPGYDLDSRCTGLATLPGSPSPIGDAPCSTPGVSTPPRDGDGGVDNALPGILSKFELNAESSDDVQANFFNDDIVIGKRTLVLAIRDYNGAEDDTNVRAELLPSEGLAGDGGPQWDGNDSWTHTEPWGNGPTLTLVGHVTAGVLVTEPKDFIVGFGAFVLKIQQGSIIARIDRETPRRLQEGTIVGRATATDLLAALGKIPIAGTECLLTGNRASLDTVCAARDIPVDRDVVTATCNAISLALGFRAVAAKLPNEAERPADAGTPCVVPQCSP